MCVFQQKMYKSDYTVNEYINSSVRLLSWLSISPHRHCVLSCHLFLFLVLFSFLTSSSSSSSEIGPASVMVGNLVSGKRIAQASGRDLGQIEDNDQARKVCVRGGLLVFTIVVIINVTQTHTQKLYKWWSIWLHFSMFHFIVVYQLSKIPFVFLFYLDHFLLIIWAAVAAVH